MHKKLIIDAFEKTKNDLIQEGINKPSKVSISERLSDYISEHTLTQLGERRFRDYYDEAISINEKEGVDIKIQQYEVVTGLAQFLGYPSYTDYISRQKKKNYKVFFYLTGVLVLVIILLAILNSDSTCWMEWKEDHYEKADFDADKLSQGTLKVCKEDRLQNFRKIETPNCDTPYFKGDGAVNIWYGKNLKGEIEVFTSLGLHPETGKTLKPITKYIITKYLCEEF
ncbi:hypothetical protein [Aestuariivivens marinum]|uniref:hypothetical protein n=1 Tax=Aestuariivivens marinum TaxID=2913555 RepID=UPI001F5A2456|nr:hypothetical protein [Aestuariivivens marinum]